MSEAGGKLQQSVVNDLGAAGGVRGHPVARGRENCVVGMVLRSIALYKMVWYCIGI